jgi:hypothetical protein
MNFHLLLAATGLMLVLTSIHGRFMEAGTRVRYPHLCAIGGSASLPWWCIATPGALLLVEAAIPPYASPAIVDGWLSVAGTVVICGGLGTVMVACVLAWWRLHQTRRRVAA